MSSAKFVGGSLINNLHSQTHNQPHGILNDLGWEIYPGRVIQFDHENKKSIRRHDTRFYT
jgi:hypothetical protein